MEGVGRDRAEIRREILELTNQAEQLRRGGHLVRESVRVVGRVGGRGRVRGRARVRGRVRVRMRVRVRVRVRMRVRVRAGVRVGRAGHP